MSRHLSNFNYPAANLNVNVTTGGEGGGGEFTVNQNPARLYDRFLLMDKFSNFYAIPRKFVETSVGSGQYHIYIPYTATLANPNWHVFRRRLFLNTENLVQGIDAGERKFIPINRPSENHKAYLHSITYAAYDFNEMIPLLNVEDKAGRIVEDMFGNDVHGIRITSTPVASDALGFQMPKSAYFTTAHYPITKENLSARTDELAVMELLGQGAPRSSVRGGMLPGDFYLNNFWMHVKGFTATEPDFDSPGSTYTSIWETPEDNSSYNVLNDLESNANSGKTDMLIPGISNEIDIEIPDNINWLCVDVAGAGWRCGAFEDDLNNAYKQVHKGLGSPTGNYFTYVQMPVKVQIDIRFWEEPVVVEGGE